MYRSRCVLSDIGTPRGRESPLTLSIPALNLHPIKQPSTIIRAQQARLAATLDAMGPEAVEQRLADALESAPGPQAHGVVLALDAATRSGARGPALFFELPDDPPGSEGAAASAAALLEAGADGLVVPMVQLGGDAGGDPPLGRLVAAVRAAAAAGQPPPPLEGPTGITGEPPPPGPPPVLVREWVVHPLQLADAKAAGAAGMLGAAAAVLGKGASLLTGMAAAMGLDVPLEVVNLVEMEAAAAGGTPLYAVNVSLSLTIPGAAQAAVANGILAALPRGAAALVGVTSREGAVTAALAGAAGLVIKREFYAASGRDGGDLGRLVEEVRAATSGDD